MRLFRFWSPSDCDAALRERDSSVERGGGEHQWVCVCVCMSGECVFVYKFVFIFLSSGAGLHLTVVSSQGEHFGLYILRLDFLIMWITQRNRHAFHTNVFSFYKTIIFL